jgi:anti-sigma regulatory factor (Ser/Thr protein kinase)
MLQRSFLPSSLPSLARHELAVRYLPGTAGLKVGGDWYDVVTLRDGRVLVAVGDVAGHGVEAASTMGRIRTSLRVHARDAAGAGDLLDRLNQYVFDDEPNEMVTLAIVIVDPAGDDVELGLAGHPPPLVRSPDGVRAVLGHPGPPLGTRRDHYLSGTTTLVTGETLLLYTDGLVERRGESFDVGQHRLEGALLAAPPDIEHVATHVVTELLGGVDHEDDVAIVAVRPTHEPNWLQMTFAPDLSALRVMREVLRRWIDRFDADEAIVDDIVLAAGEAAANAISHASGVLEESFVVSARYEDGAIVVEVRDFGTWRRPRAGHDGRGITLMRVLSDAVTIDSSTDGTSVRLRTSLR